MYSSAEHQTAGRPRGRPLIPKNLWCSPGGICTNRRTQGRTPSELLVLTVPRDVMLQQWDSLPRRYSSPGFDTGSDFNKTASTNVKIEVVALMPNASVRTVALVNAGAIRNRRNAWSKS